MKKSYAYTVAETLITLTIVGLIAAILVPIAAKCFPDKNVLKFKKGNATLAAVIKNLITEEKFYKYEDLGRRPNYKNVTQGADNDYLCKTIADALNTKDFSCLENSHCPSNYNGVRYKTSTTSLSDFKKYLDNVCASNSYTKDNVSYIKTSDDIVYFEPCNKVPFGATKTYASGNKYIYPNPTDFSDEINESGSIVDGIDVAYKVICIDIDGIGTGEAPFGYGLKRDGIILTGARADEWSPKSAKRNE